jgi:hypothetical protein
VSTGIKAVRLKALAEIDTLTDEIYAKRARKRRVFKTLCQPTSLIG